MRSINGVTGNILPENKTEHVFKDTVLMGQCPYIRSLIAEFPCEHKAVSLLKMNPGSVIKEHRDNDLSFEKGEARI